MEMLHPNQTAVHVFDQPLYALSKQVQWGCPLQFSASHYFVMVGGLHLEQAMLVVHGQVIKGSGLDHTLEMECISVIGLKTAAVDVNQIKRARYAVQVVSCAIYIYA